MPGPVSLGCCDTRPSSLAWASTAGQRGADMGAGGRRKGSLTPGAAEQWQGRQQGAGKHGAGGRTQSLAGCLPPHWPALLTPPSHPHPVLAPAPWPLPSVLLEARGPVAPLLPAL